MSAFGEESRVNGSTRPLDDGGYIGYDPRLSSQRFESSFSNFDTDSVEDSASDSSPIFTSQAYSAGDNMFFSHPVSESPPSIYSGGIDGEFSTTLSPEHPEKNGQGFNGGFGGSAGSILPPPAEMQSEEGFALREWRRGNAIVLEEKEKKEKEVLQQIIEEAEEYKREFYSKCQLTMENKKASNREKEKLFLANREKFHAEAEKNYWKAIAELIPYEVPAIEKRGKKDQEKKPSVVLIQGPKPGKPTDLSRMRQILIKLKHNPPPHMKTKPPASTESTKDAEAASPAATATPNAAPTKAISASATATTPETVSAA